jgi:hypothetical protein
MVRQQQAQAITPQPAGVHITTQVFAVAGTNEPYILRRSKTPIAVLWLDYESRAAGRDAVVFLPRPPVVWWPFSFQ